MFLKTGFSFLIVISLYSCTSSSSTEGKGPDSTELDTVTATTVVKQENKDTTSIQQKPGGFEELAKQKWILVESDSISGKTIIPAPCMAENPGFYFTLEPDVRVAGQETKVWYLHMNYGQEEEVYEVVETEENTNHSRIVLSLKSVASGTEKTIEYEIPKSNNSTKIEKWYNVFDGTDSPGTFFIRERDKAAFPVVKEPCD